MKKLSYGNLLRKR